MVTLTVTVVGQAPAHADYKQGNCATSGARLQFEDIFDVPNASDPRCSPYTPTF
jgi:hypothetical protein